MLKLLLNDFLSKLGIIFLGIFIVLSIAAPLIQIHAPNQIDLLRESEPPSFLHPFGTDELGRDIWSRAWHGGRISLTVGFVAVSISILLGSLIGSISGFFGGRIDSFLMRCVDVLLSLPTIFLILTIQAVLKPSIWNVMMVIGLTSWMGVARLVRAEFLKIKKQTYVLAKKAYGFSNFHLIFKTILPNAAGPLIVAATLGMAGAVMTESVLSFFGLGVQLPAASWGNMLQNAQDTMLDAPWQSVIPGLLIFMTVLSLNFVGDAVRKYWSVKER